MVRRLVASVIALFAAAIFVAVSPSAAYADATRDKQWYLDSLRINKAHTLSQGAGVTIGLIDGGVDATHSDLKGNIKAGADFGDSKDSGLHDSDGHGTGMASILVAHGHGKGHAQGVMGIAPKAKLISYGIDCDIHCTGRTGSDGVADGIKWLTDKGVDIISISLGATPSPDAVKYATDKGVAVVASAGNDVSDFGPGIG
ncbi:MAG TPA: S8 family serine peptidase, partial [Stackebrandtia sp.]|nr:S8 family serine peptidase [Stackebrandtia sp.]